MANGVRTLRDTVKLDDACTGKFDQAERLAKSIFEREDCVPLPYFTPHEASHCEAVEKYLDQIIWGRGEPGPYDFVPTPEEATYLLSSVWLHDIGMTYGIREGENPNDLTDYATVAELRRKHEVRTIRYIHEMWKWECTWSEEEKTLLTTVCAYHRRHREISTLEPVRIASKCDGKPIRLVTLAALLRLADACHEDQSRAPGRLMQLYKSLGMPQEAANHWERAKVIAAVVFDHTNRAITLRGYCPPEFKLHSLIKFDLGEIVEIVRQDVEQELSSVQQVLLRYPNTYFGEVKSDIFRPVRLELDQEEQYMALWPYLLDNPSGSTEAAAALAQMLLLAVRVAQKTGKFGKPWRDNTFSPIMNKTRESRPFDFMVRNLCRGVENVLSGLRFDARSAETSAETLTKHLEDFLNGVSESCRRLAEFGPTLVRPGDVLVIHGYCRNIASFLESLKPECNNMLYIVDYQEPLGNVRLGPSQNRKMITFANNVGFSQVRFLTLPSLAQVLSELKRKGTPCKVLLGTHGVLESKALLCKVGSYMIVNTAKQFGAQVIAFAEETKFLINGESDEDVASPEKIFSSEKMCKRHPEMTDTMCLTPEVDLVPKELLVPKEIVDLVLTEKGAFPPDAVPIPAEKSGLVSEKKESNPE
jgi:translation initiation factor 2B subunit (eIF-2B alpha/beta/delta family)